MADKTWSVTFELKELPASHTWHSATVEASNIGLAINRAWAEVKTRHAVKGRRISYGKVMFEILKGASE